MKLFSLKSACLVLGLSAGSSFAQESPLVSPPGMAKGYYEPKGYYGTSYGSPSYGSVRTYSAFSSPFGSGLRYGYGPSLILPGRSGMGIWRPNANTAADLYAGSSRSYRTWAVPYVAGAPVPALPPMGVYAPDYGPGLNGW